MASFTDNKTPTFNPYVQQQPVESMVKVGMAKQQQYDQGVQKIQHTIDNIAGLDLARDIDKQYLESKLSDVGGRLGVFAAADFSQSEMTRSVNGMIGSIGNDETIQNAVQSTQNYRKGLKDRDYYTKKGKGSASNDWLFNQEAQQWFNSEDPNDSFSGKYKQYTEYNKNALAIVKNVLKDENISDSDFYIDEKGQVVFTDEMVRTKLAGKSREKIQSALMAGLSPDDWQQIEIDGRYQYSNMSGEAFEQEITSSYNNTMTALNGEKQRLSDLQKVAASPSVQASLQQALLGIESAIQKEDSQYNVLDSYFQKDQMEGAKAKLFTMNWMNNMGNSFSSVENSRTLHASPRALAKRAEEKENRRIREWGWTFDQRAEFHEDDKEHKAKMVAAAEEANRISLNDLATGGYGPVPNAKNAKELLNMTPDVLQENIDIAEGVIDREKITIGKYYTSEEEYQFSGDKDKYPTYEDYAADFMNDQEEIYRTQPAALKSKVRSFFDKKIKADRVLETKKHIKAQAEALGNQQFDLLDSLDDEDKSRVYDFELEDGSVYAYTVKEIVNFNSKFNEIRKSINFNPGGGYSPYSPTGPTNNPVNILVNKMGLSLKEKKLLEVTLKEQGDLGGFANLLSEGEQGMSDVIFDLKKKYNSKVEKQLKEKNEFQKKYISERLMSMQGQTHSINLSTKQPGGAASNMDQFKSVLGGFALNASQKGGLMYSPDVTAESINLIIPTLDSADIQIIEDVYVDGEKKNIYNVTARNTKGKSVSFRVSADEYDGVFKGKFDRSPTLEVFQEYKRRIIGIKGSTQGAAIGTTAMDGRATNKDNAYLGKVDFPNINLFGVSGNLVSQDGKHYELELNIKIPGQDRWLENIEFDSVQKLDVDMLKQMQSFSDRQVFELLTKRQPTEEEFNALIEAAKNIE